MPKPDLPPGSCQVSLTVRLPNEMLGPFLQHIRNFENQRPSDVILTMALDTPHLAAARLKEMLEEIRPPFATMGIFTPDTHEMVRMNGQPGIKCLKCGRVSFNPNDIEQRYCGYCHAYHPITTAG